MSKSSVAFESLPDFSLWKKMESKHIPLAFDLEVTARCNNNCRHCYINLPADDQTARQKELSLEEIGDIAGQAVSLGALWCLITGGEPLLRDDFADIYLGLKKKGLLVSVFTHAGLLTEKHIKLFNKFPPRDVEVTVYGVTRKIYETVTRRPGSFDAFRHGLDLLLKAGIKVRLKAMALRSNLHELPAIARFCRQWTKDYFRFDPFLHLRFDGDLRRNEDIRAERLSPEEIATLEQNDKDRASALKKMCRRLSIPKYVRHQRSAFLFQCGLGWGSFSVSFDGLLRLCQSLCQPDCVYDLRRGRLSDAWLRFVPNIRAIRSTNKDFLKKCSQCTLLDLCMCCPAHAYLEHGRLDAWCQYFCEVAHARAEAIKRIARKTSQVDRL